MQEGFFSKKETQSMSRPDGKTYSCVSCGLYKDCTSPKMQPYGNFKQKILVIGEAPGETEDRLGKPWQGKSGRLLQRSFKRLGMDLFEDCLNINAVYCRPMDKDNNNRAPNNYEVECCRKTTLQIVDKYKPKVIILLGAMALYSLIGHRWLKDLGSISKWRGFTIPDQDFNAWLCPTFHPSYIERINESSVEEVIWMSDLKQAFEKVKEKIPLYKEPKIEIITDLSILSTIKTDLIAFDYETTGLKPHATGHRIVCCSIATNENHAFVFMMPSTKRERLPLMNLLANPNVGKIAQNMKYEDTWSVVRLLGTEVENWVWDPMLASHILDNRPGITGLKFQVYVQFGIVDYSSEVTSYLGADKTNANSINKIMELVAKPGGKEKLMKYNGYDAIYEYRLAMLQREIILEDDLPF